jgi:uncharacterized protein (DUF1810 family)
MEAEKISKFLDAQQYSYQRALDEIKKGKKQGHWMWYIFPQIRGLGMSSTSVHYGIENMQHATQYLHHPLLGMRLVEISYAILTIEGKSANQILGSPDDLKLRSSMTLFNEVKSADPIFQQVLDKYFSGLGDQRTLDILNVI